MTFYFKPPRGEIQFHNLQECLEERMSYLRYVRETSDISDCNECFKFEYLTDGSALDRTGHFMLRMLAIKLMALKNFFLESETLLFEKRLMHLGYIQVQQELNTALRHVKEILSTFQPLCRYSQFLKNFKKFCEDILSSRALQHSFSKSHSQDCQQYSVNVPFTFCLSLVVTREVDLKGGMAVVPCGKYSKLLTDLFLEHLRHGIQQLLESKAFQKAWTDDRLRFLFQIVRAQFRANHHTGYIPRTSKTLLANDVDKKCSIFPPCMKNFHKTLRLRHRLSHYSRFYYSLFLKDIGMPLMESVEFWSQEYAQSITSCSSCSHTWQKDSKRFMYSIRHLYGLEGSRREYSSPPCCQIQAMSHSASSDGGCPFEGFDKQNLKKCLHEEVQLMKGVENNLMDVRKTKGAKGACEVYLEMLLDIITQQNIETLNADKLTAIKSSSKDCLFSGPSNFYDIIDRFSAQKAISPP